jgi:hypothetical protein
VKVLITHEVSGRVRDAFIRRGHWALSCDLLPSDSDFGPHVVCRDGEHVFRLAEAFRPDLLIGFPDCTFVCGSGLHWCRKDPSRLAKRDAAVLHFQRLLESDFPRICLENPVGHLSTAIRKPDQIIQPYQFGEDASKATCLWLKGLPKLAQTGYVPPRMVCPTCGATCKPWEARGHKGCPHCGAEEGQLKPRWSNQTDSGQNRLGPSPGRAKLRSTTFWGVADAMASQWTNL